jgi:hypothetical protein
MATISVSNAVAIMRNPSMPLGYRHPNLRWTPVSVSLLAGDYQPCPISSENGVHCRPAGQRLAQVHVRERTPVTTHKLMAFAQQRNSGSSMAQRCFWTSRWSPPMFFHLLRHAWEVSMLSSNTTKYVPVQSLHELSDVFILGKQGGWRETRGPHPLAYQVEGQSNNTHRRRKLRGG